MSEDKLKMCPFCGGQASVVVSGDKYGKLYHIDCNSCGTWSGGKENQPEAIKAWNHRPHVDELVKAVDEWDQARLSLGVRSESITSAHLKVGGYTIAEEKLTNALKAYKEK